MKLLNYTTSYFALILIFLLSIWAVIFYIEILDEIYDSMDDGLDNQKMLVIRKAAKDPALLKKNTFDEGNFIITPTSSKTAEKFTDAYRDTLMFMENEEDFEPVRLLESAFRHEGEYYKIKVITSMVEEDDLIKELFFSLIWLYVGLILTILLLNNFLHKKVWQPFYKLLRSLEKFNIEKDTEIKFGSTKVEEFQLLNERIDKLLKKSVESYTSQKEFIENASHELQTPLAISINKLELLAENSSLEPQQMEELGLILNNLERLTRLNRALLLLSRIENRQFADEETVNFNQLLKQINLEFEDLASHNSIEVDVIETAELQYNMSKDLARILVANLLKNALLHTPAASRVKVEIFKNQILIQNLGEKPLNPKTLFSRFQPGKRSHSNGLGLAISKAIADRYNLEINYDFRDNLHSFTINF
ncbi:Signal transduction histidine kinase [Salinimicrobium sediminis]|uniref:histidine kinase n=1 Tax=Salinimicrobium sediminis TaxID=1343891 RepID=A0A285X648_9FLAO|nr:HAMP domain-containing sensor histidine kinase [Salinimicrobium sediminis]SOC80817.1 Signal transduction histidine kinase [Salinimicrobium sediminis]